MLITKFSKSSYDRFESSFFSSSQIKGGCKIRQLKNRTLSEIANKARLIAFYSKIKNENLVHVTEDKLEDKTHLSTHSRELCEKAVQLQQTKMVSKV